MAMMLVYLRNGECIEIEAAVKADVHDGTLFCMDDKEEVIATYATTDVEVYTANRSIATVLEEQICEDLTTIPADPAETAEPGLGAPL
jgi:hypothetical protein